MNRLIAALGVLLLCATPLAAQEAIAPARPAQAPRPAPPAPPPAAPPAAPATPLPAPRAPAPPRPPQADSTQNVSIQLTITDSMDQAARKTVMMVVADRRNGRIRTINTGSPLNVDASATVVRDGRIQLYITLEYQTAETGFMNLNESLSVLVTDGKPLVISQSADPKSDRKVTVEVTATIVK